MSFVKTGTILDRILARKVEEVAALRSDPAVRSALEAQARDAVPSRDFVTPLRQKTVALIAEIKKASPSKGLLAPDFDPVALARVYQANGAAAISVLTDESFFQGSLADLRAVRAVVELPLLRKDFIIDPIQILESRAVGADAVLLIVMALDDARLADLYSLVRDLGMTALVEVHNEAELERALQLGVSLIGVNNRDLRNFVEDLTTIGRLARLIPPGVTIVAESAIRSPLDVLHMGELGAHAVLVGEALVRAHDQADQVRHFASQSRLTSLHDGECS